MRAWAGVRASVQEHRPLLVLVIALLIASHLAEWALGLDVSPPKLWYWPTYRYYLVFLPFPLVFVFLFTRLRVCDSQGKWLQGREGWASAWNRFRSNYLTVHRVSGALLSGLAIAVTINLFGSWKLRITHFQDFAWDQRLAALDKLLHFGRNPWEWLQPMVGYPPVTSSIDWLYYTWTPMIAIFCAWQAWSPHREVRLRFFVTAVFIWVGLGNVMATLLSSAGPCYWDELGIAPNPFDALFEYHRGVWGTYLFGTRGFQNDLWVRHAGLAPTTPYTAISAMPSIHVAMTVLYALAAWRTRWWLGAVFVLYALVILVGSIHLGWHYAVDGYASILAVPVLWWVVGRLLSWRPERQGGSPWSPENPTGDGQLARPA